MGTGGGLFNVDDVGKQHNLFHTFYCDHEI